VTALERLIDEYTVRTFGKPHEEQLVADVRAEHAALLARIAELEAERVTDPEACDCCDDGGTGWEHCTAETKPPSMPPLKVTSDPGPTEPYEYADRAFPAGWPKW